MTWRAISARPYDGELEAEGMGNVLAGALFTGIPWSTGTVLADSVAAAERVGLSVAPYQAADGAEAGAYTRPLFSST
jgi:hypothetical protein